MSLWAVLATGLLAGGASCAAVQGGLLAGTLARRRPAGAAVDRGARARNKAGAPPDPPRSLRQDLAPVGAFLGGKLASHVVLGAALGVLGDAIQFSPQIRGSVQIVAGIAMLALALDLMGVAGLRGLVPAAPPAWARLVRRSGRTGGSLGPALLGAATILIPCGVTLSMMFLAVASGSLLSGAAIMGAFVLGTAPLFGLIGYAAKRSAAVVRGRLNVVAGAAVLIAGLVSLNAGLVLNGSPVTISGAWRAVTGGETEPVAAPAPAADGVQRIVINAYDTGYSPSNVVAQPGIPTTLTFRTDKTEGCTRALLMDAFDVERVLPATGDTLVDVGELEPGTYTYTCGMGMYEGSITVQAL